MSAIEDDSHEINRRSWDRVASFWHKRIYTERWRTASTEPLSILLEDERAHLGDVRGKDICVLGSGNAVRDFALAGLGANVTSVDISQEQLDRAARKAGHLGLQMRFLRADVVDLSPLADGAFDAIYASHHVATWIRDLRRYVAEAVRILKGGGTLLFNEVHPATRLAEIQEDGHDTAAYFHPGPYEIDRSSEVDDPPERGIVAHEFLWTLEDYVTAILDAGCRLTGIMEYEKTKLEDGVLRAHRGRVPKCVLLAAIREEQPRAP